MDKVTDSDINISIEFLKEHKDITLMSNGIPVAKIDSAYMANVFQELKQLRAENARMAELIEMQHELIMFPLVHADPDHAILRDKLDAAIDAYERFQKGDGNG